MASAQTYTPIATITASGSTTSVTFSSIPQTYTDLVIAGAFYETSSSNTSLQFNGDTGSNYSSTSLLGNGSTASSARVSNFPCIFWDRQGNATGYGTGVAHIMNYSNTTTYKTALLRYGYAGTWVEEDVGSWHNTSAITSITVGVVSGSGNLASGSTYTLYGILAA